MTKNVMCWMRNLHSSMERLKGQFDFAFDAVAILFTFQYGEIKSHLRTHSEPRRLRFTFQYGEIKREYSQLFRFRMLSFTFQYGEIKRCCLVRPDSQAVQFTFQYGEIKSDNHCIDAVRYANLHSSMERLKEQD